MPIRAACSRWAAICPASGYWKPTGLGFFPGIQRTNRSFGGRRTRVCPQNWTISNFRAAWQDDAKGCFQSDLRPGFRGCHRGLRRRAAGWSEGHLDHAGDASSLYPLAWSGLCPFRGDLVRRRAGRRALRRVLGQGVFRRVDVSSPHRCVESCAGDVGGETQDLGFSLYRLADDDGSYAAPRREGDCPGGFF